MSNDPWLTAEGKLHPAAEKVVPEWKDGPIYRLRLEPAPPGHPAQWRVDWYDADRKKWYLDHRPTAHEAAALLEKAAREWLWAEHRVALCPEPSDEGLRWRVNKRGKYEVKQWLGQNGKWYTKCMDVGYFAATDYTAAQQAGILATVKGKDDAETTDE